MTVQAGLCQTWSEPKIVGFLTHRLICLVTINGSSNMVNMTSWLHLHERKKDSYCENRRVNTSTTTFHKSPYTAAFTYLYSPAIFRNKLTTLIVFKQSSLTRSGQQGEFIYIHFVTYERKDLLSI